MHHSTFNSLSTSSHHRIRLHIMNSIWILVVAFILTCFAWTIGSLSLSSLPRQSFIPEETDDREESEEFGIPVIKDFNCYDLDDKPYIADIPHPYRCDLFIKCSPYLGENGELIPVGVQANCPNGHNGIILRFSMETCNCEYPEDAICFDENNSTHLEEKFKCACPLLPDGRGGYVQDDKCSHHLGS